MSESVIADRPAKPRPYVKTSDFSPYYVTVVPGSSSDGFSAAFKLHNDGTSTEVWRIRGYSFEVYLSRNGRYFVRMGPWASGSKPSGDDVAVEFFGNGELLKSYSTTDLVKDDSKVKRTVSHYIWRSAKKELPFLSSTNKFHLETIDGVYYQFDVTSGEIIDVQSP